MNVPTTSEWVDEGTRKKQGQTLGQSTMKDCYSGVWQPNLAKQSKTAMQV